MDPTGFPEMAKLSDSWWFARIAPHPAPTSLVLQTRVMIALYFLIVCIPSLTDLVLNEGSYNVLYGSYVVPSICISTGFLLLVWFLVNSDGGAWHLFWNHKFVPNVICMILTPAILGLAQWGFAFLINPVVKAWPALVAYKAVDPASFPASMYLPMALFTIVSQETVTRAFLVTRTRQIGGVLLGAVVWSTLLFSMSNLGWGMDAFASSVVSGALLTLVYARWGGLAGVILGRLAWECSNFIKI